MEAADPADILFVDRQPDDRPVLLHLELPHPVVDPVVVVRVVLEGVDLPREALFGALSGVEVRAVGVERSVGVGGVGEPAAALFPRDDVDHTADGVRPELHRNDPLVDLDALGIVHRDVVQVEGRRGPLLRDAVDEDLDVAAAEAVEHQLHVGPHAARSAELHARELRQGVAQIAGRVAESVGGEGHGVEGRMPHAVHRTGLDDDLVDLQNGGMEEDGERFVPVAVERHGGAEGLVADRRDDKVIGAGRCLQPVAALCVGRTAEGSPLQGECCEVYGRGVGRHHAARESGTVAGLSLK